MRDFLVSFMTTHGPFRMNPVREIAFDYALRLSEVATLNLDGKHREVHTKDLGFSARFIYGAVKRPKNNYNP
jgi:hypothetical protein